MVEFPTLSLGVSCGLLSDFVRTISSSLCNRSKTRAKTELSEAAGTAAELFLPSREQRTFHQHTQLVLILLPLLI